LRSGNADELSAMLLADRRLFEAAESLG